MFFSSLRFCFCFLLPLPLVSLFLPPPSHFPSSPSHFSFPSSPSLLIPHLTFPFLRLPLTSFHLPLLLSFPPTHLSFSPSLPPSRFPSPSLLLSFPYIFSFSFLLCLPTLLFFILFSFLSCIIFLPLSFSFRSPLRFLPLPLSFPLLLFSPLCHIISVFIAPTFSSPSCDLFTL